MPFPDSPPAVRLGLEGGEPAEIPAYLRSHAVLDHFPPGGGRGREAVWRIAELLGYGPSPYDRPAFPFSTTPDNDAECAGMVINDAGLGFRDHKDVWPAAVLGGAAPPEWIVLKMSPPIASGDLWLRLSEEYRDRLVVVTAARDLRAGEAMITEGVSWERTVQDFIVDLNANPDLRELLACRYLVVDFGAEGALWVDNPAGGPPVYRLVFDPEHLEGAWRRRFPGSVLGAASCFACGVAARLFAGGPPGEALDAGVTAGLSAMRRLVESGHGPASAAAPSFPLEIVAEAAGAAEPKYRFGAATPPDDPALFTADWTLMEQGIPPAERTPLFGRARKIARYGVAGLQNIPYARFGKLVTVDRGEIESLHTLQRLILDYAADPAPPRPLSIGVFGPPGAGKSFGIKQIAKAVPGAEVSILEFNLSQFNDPAELIGAYHRIRDDVLTGKLPFAFFDEFDSRDLFWLQYLLAPMQDGKFLEGEWVHPIGKCVFVFAGGTSAALEGFIPPRSNPDAYAAFKFRKGPDFVSRLKGYLNVRGPNPVGGITRETAADETGPARPDVWYPVRRAFLLRGILGLSGDERLEIDGGLLSAFLKIDTYLHGTRSLETIIGLTKTSGNPPVLQPAKLPPPEKTKIHVDAEAFMKLITEDLAFKAACDQIAPHIHEYYRKLGRREGWLRPDLDRPYDALPKSIRADNRAAAVRIPDALSLTGLMVVPADDPRPAAPEDTVQRRIESDIEFLAEVEHDGWMRFKRRNGWRFGETRDDERKIHDCLIPYRDLTDSEREKDRNNVRRYPELVAEAGFKIVFET
jgi:hypothetical protein